MSVLHILAPDEEVDRPFAALAHSAADLATMNRMRQRLRAHVEATLQDKPAADYQYSEFRDEQRGFHRIVLPRWPAAVLPQDMVAVGFFGQARNVDHEPIMELEEKLIERMDQAEGLITYYNVFWPQVGWGNLVLFTSDETKTGWGHDRDHHRAVELSPNHYHSIRLHNGRLPGGILGPHDVELTKTRYFDFSRPEPWLAERIVA